MTKPKRELEQKSARLGIIEETRFAITELKEELKKHERVHKLLLNIEQTDIPTYKVHDRILDIEGLIVILQLSLKEMGGR